MADEEFTLTPVKKKDNLVEVPVERPSNPFRQAAAGVTDIGTGLVSLLGLGGAGIQAGYNTLFDEGGIKENFAKAVTDEGIDQTLLEAGASGRQFFNELLGIEDPITTEDQIARIAGGFVPIPGFQVLSGAGKLANTLKHTSNVLLPTVRRGKGGGAGFARRGAAQLGIGLGADQGLRALTDHPLMFSEQALSGKAPPIELADPPGGDETLVGGAGLDSLIEKRELVAQAGTQDEFTLIPTKRSQAIEVDPDIIEGNADGADKLRELDRKVEKEQGANDLVFWGTMLGVAITGGAGAKYLHKGVVKKHGSVRNYGQYLHEQTVDKAQALADTLRKQGHSEDAVQSVVHNAHSDWLDVAVNFLQTGRLGQDFTPKAGMTAHSHVKLRGQHRALGENRQLADDAMLAQTERAARIHKPGELWQGSRTEKELDDIINEARAIPEVKQWMDDMTETFDVLLDYQVSRGTLTTKQANKFRENARLPGQEGQPGRLAYMPLYSKDPTTFMQRLSRNYLGVNTKAGREAAVIAEFGPRGTNVGMETLSPLDAVKKYSLSTIKHANEEAFKAGVLAKLARVSHVAGNTTRQVGKTQTGREFVMPTARDTQFVGRGTDLDDINKIPIEIFSGNKKIKSMFDDGSINDLRAGNKGNELVTVHTGGELLVYHVPDSGVRAALDLSNKLSPGLNALSHWKNLFTRGTTGNLSLFAPISHMFSAQQTAINVVGRSAKDVGYVRAVGQGFRAGTWDSLKGTGKLMYSNMARDRAEYLTQRIAKHVGEGRIPPEAMINRQKRLEQIYMDSVVNHVRTESGRTVTGIGNVGTGSIDDIMRIIGKDSAEFFGRDQMGLVKNLWNSWNNAWHEGPAFGAMLRHIGKVHNEGGVVGPKVIREAVDISKTVSGDMRRVGAGQAAQIFNAAFPFSSAMVQSWNSIAGAARADWGKFIVGASALIGFPTVSELAYNKVLSEASGTFPDPSGNGKQWTYNDYYWNGFTTQQRSDNFIYFVPGRPPWEAVVIPVSPEWGLFRGIVMESMDAIFNFSDVGAIGMVDQDKTNRSQFWTAFTRVLDIPMPPPAAAIASYLGTDIRLGLAEEIGGEDGPVSIIRKIPLGQGERVTRRGGQAKFAEGYFDRTTVAIMQDIFGAAGTAMVNFGDAFMSGADRKEGSIVQGLSEGLESLSVSAQSQMRYTQPLFGKVLHPNANDEIAANLHAARETLTGKGGLADQLRNGYIGAGIAYADGQMIEGDTIIPSDDPINMELAASAQLMDSNIGQLDSQIAKLRKDLTTIPLSQNLGSQRDRRSLTDSKTLEIQALKAQQLAVIHGFEKELSRYLSERYDRDIDIDLTSYKPRPNVREGSGVQELLRPPQTSQ